MEAAHGPDHPDVAAVLSHFAALLHEQVINRVDLLPGNWYRILLILRGAILSRTCGTHKNLYTSLFLLTIFGPNYYGPPY